MRGAIFLTLIALAGCKAEPSADASSQPEPDVSASAEAPARIKTPAMPIALQPLNEADSAQAGLEGAGCSFAPTGQEEPVLLADLSVAVVKAKDMTMTLAVDGNAPSGQERYAGQTHTARIEHAAGPGAPWGDEGVSWQAVLTVQDPDQREVYRSAGTFVCSA